MAQSLAQNTREDSNPNAQIHTAVEMGPLSGREYLLQSGGLFSEKANDFFDGSYALYALYNEKTAELDKELVSTWSEHVRDLMVLSGLLSAAIAAFLAQSYIAFLEAAQKSQDSSTPINSLPGNVGSDGNTPEANPPPTPESRVVVTHVLWFAGLGMTLSSAMLAALLQSWVRRYVILIKSQQNPRSRALIRAYVILQKSLTSLQLLIDFLHFLLDCAVFAFLAGLIWLLPATFMRAQFVLSPSTSNFVVPFIALPLLVWYTNLTLMSFCGHTIYSTPLSRAITHLGRSILLVKGCLISTFKSLQRPRLGCNAFIGSDWVSLDRIDLVVNKLTDSHPSSLDQEIMAWLVHSLHHDQDLERFLEGIPSFYKSDLVEKPAEIFRSLNTDKLPYAILSFMHRALSSVTLPQKIKQTRVRLSLEVMEQDPYLLQRTFFHALFLPTKPYIFQSIDFILVADRLAFQANGSQDVKLLAKCILTVAISHLTNQELELDARWLGLLESWSGSPMSRADITSGGRLASMRLDTLISLVAVLSSAGPPYSDQILNRTLQASGNFLVENVAIESQTRFCVLWNQLRDWAAVVPDSSASYLLPNFRTIYNTLHGGTNDSPINRSFTVTNYPRCANPVHPPNPHWAPEAGTDAAHARDEAPRLSRRHRE